MVYAAVTAKFPGTFVDADIGVYTNVEASPLTTAVVAGTVSFVVNDGTKFLVNMYVALRSVNGYEVVLITAINSNTLTVTRARDGTTAVAHPVGTAVRAVAPALFFNQVRVELQAIEDALGGSGLDEDLILEAGVALVGDQLKDSPGVVLRGKYWNGSASADYDARVYHDLLTTGPTSQLRWTFGGTDKMLLSSGGVLSVDTLQVLTASGSLTIKNQGGTARATLSDVGVLEVTTSISTPIVRGVTGSAITLGGTAAGVTASQVRLYSPDDTDFLAILNGGHQFFTASVSRVNIGDSSVAINNATPLVFNSGADVTEQSRFTPSVGATTWLAASGSDIIIQNDQANNAIVINDGVNGSVQINRDGSGTAYLGGGANDRIGIDTAIRLEMGLAHLYVVSSASFQFRGGYPAIFYSDAGVTEQSRITPTAGVTTWLASLATDIVIDTATGAIAVGSATLGADGSARLTSPDGTDFYHAENGILDIIMNNVNTLRLTDSVVSINNARPLVFYSGNVVTEESRFTIAVGSTTWAGASNSNMIIRTAGNASLDLGLAVSSVNGTELRAGMSTTTFMIGQTTLIGFNVSGNSLIVTATENQIRNARPLVFYSGDGTDERFHLNTTEILYAPAVAIAATLNDSPNFTLRISNHTGVANETFDAAQIYEDLAGGGTADVDTRVGWRLRGVLGFSIIHDEGVNACKILLPPADRTTMPVVASDGAMIYDSNVPAGIYACVVGVWTQL